MALRAAVFVDGYNLYCALEEAGLYREIWLDLEWLAKRTLWNWTHGTQSLEYVKLFTSVPEHQKDKAERHRTYLSALGAKCPLLEVVEGTFQRSDEMCPHCQKKIVKWKEKKADSLLTAHLLQDAHLARFDVSYILSADADHIPVFSMVNRHFTGCTVKWWYPPGRFRQNLHDAANQQGYELRATDVRKCQLPDPVVGADGKQRFKPQKWK